MFDKFLHDLENKPKTEIKMTQLSLASATDNLRENIDSIKDSDLYNIILQMHKSILKEIYNRSDQSYIDIFTTPRFIIMLTKVLDNTPTPTPDDERIYYNKLIYDFLTLKEEDGDSPREDFSYKTELMFSLAKAVNKNITPKLYSLGLTDRLANYLTLARFSSFEEMVNVKRLNFLISIQSDKLMTEQMIVDIYQILFENVTTLFKATMLDVYNEDEEWIAENPSVMEIYGNISNAVLALLESLTTEGIRSVLISYHGDLGMVFKNKPTRFKLSALSNDYSRILNVIEFLKEEDIYIY